MIMHTECCCFVYIYTPMVFECFVKKKKIFDSTKCKQNISNTKKETKKENNSLCSFYKTIKCTNNVNDSNKNVTNFF